MMEQGSLLINEQNLFKLFGLAVNTSVFTHLLVPQAGQGKLEKLYLACFKTEAKSLCCAYLHLPDRSQRDWKYQCWSESSTNNPSKLLSKITMANDPKTTISMNFASCPLAIFQPINERFLQSYGNVVPLMSFGMETCQRIFENPNIFCPHAY